MQLLKEIDRENPDTLARITYTRRSPWIDVMVIWIRCFILGLGLRIENSSYGGLVNCKSCWVLFPALQPEWWWRGKRARTRAWAWIYTSRTGPQGKIVWFIFQTSWIMFIFQSLLIIPLSPPFIRMYLKWAYLWSVLLVCHDDFFLVLYLASFTGKLSRSSSSFVFLLFSVK